MQRTGQAIRLMTLTCAVALLESGCAGARGSTRPETPAEPAPAPASSPGSQVTQSSSPWTPAVPAQPEAGSPGPRVARVSSEDGRPAIEPERWTGAEDLIPAAEGRARARRAPALSETAFLFIEAEPRSAFIVVDGARVGEGQAFLRVKGSRWKVLRAEASGYEAVEGAVEVREREVVKVRLSLAPIGGRLTVVTDTPGAQVLLDDQPVGTTPLTLSRVTTGSHRLVLRAGSWQWSGNVEVRPGETRLIEMMVQAAAPTPAPEPPGPAFAPPPAIAAPEPPPPAPPAAPPAPVTPPPPVTTSAPVPPGSSGEPSSQEASAAPTASGRPDCQAVCRRFVQAVAGSDSIREPIFNRCGERCRSGDLRFSVCAWKARDMNDVATCMNLPE